VPPSAVILGRGLLLCPFFSAGNRLSSRRAICAPWAEWLVSTSDFQEFSRNPVKQNNSQMDEVEKPVVWTKN
jgi:hypothetical protein